MTIGKKDFLSIRDFTRDELQVILDIAIRQKPLAKSFRLPASFSNVTPSEER